MAVKRAVIRMIINNIRRIGENFGCAAVVARNTITILVIIVATIFLVIIRYDIGSAIVIIIFIGRMLVEIMFIVMNIVVGDHRPCFLA